jgi:hypothetical protein
MSLNVNFITPTLLKSRTGISDAIDDKHIIPHIKTAQDMYIQPTLGSGLYLRLQTGIGAGNLNTNEKNLLDVYITDCLIWYVMSQLPFALGYQFFSKGVLQKTSEDSNTPARADLELISRNYKDSAEFYKQRMIGYLRQNYSLYSEYINPGNGYDVIFPETKAYTCALYLGGVNTPDFGQVYGVNSASSSPTTVYIVPSAGVSTFSVPELTGKTVIIATRSGMVKGITSAPTSNTLYLQISGSVVTLPTGDITMANELFSFTYR